MKGVSTLAVRVFLTVMIPVFVPAFVIGGIVQGLIDGWRFYVASWEHRR